MSCGMVRKIDELGRVVLPKEMRRILNIKTGSSVEMEIDENNKIVLSKFSEVENVLSMANCLGEIVYEKLNLKCLICDDDKVLCVCGESKKEFLHKKVLVNEFKKPKLINLNKFLDVENVEEVCVRPICLQGFNKGFIVVWENSLQNDRIDILIEYFSCLIKD